MISDSGGGGPSRADGALEPKLLLEGFPRIAIRRVVVVVVVVVKPRFLRGGYLGKGYPQR